MRENLSGVCKQQRRRPACASAQSNQHLCYSLFNFLASAGGETGLRLGLSETPKTDAQVSSTRVTSPQMPREQHLRGEKTHDATNYALVVHFFRIFMRLNLALVNS